MPKPEDHTPLGESIGEIIDRTTKIVHEEIELAKAEMASAAQDLLRGSVAGIVGGVFAFFGLFILLIAFSFLVADAVGAWYPWLGFFIVAFICFALGGVLAFVALKKIKKGSQLAPTQAIDEAKQTRDALQAEADKGVETIDSTAVEEVTAVKPPAATHPDVEPAKPAKSPEVAEADAKAAEAKDDLKEAREDADELQLDAKEAKRRAKQEAKEAKEAGKAAKKAEQEAAKAEAIAAKQAEKAQKEADKARAKAEKEAEKNAKKAAKSAGKGEEAADEPAATEQPAQGEPQRYVAPQPPAQQPAPPQTPPAPPTAGGPTPPPTPPAPPTDPTENN